MKYTVTVLVHHEDDGDIDFDVQVEGAGHSDGDRQSIAWAMRMAAERVENGTLVLRSSYS